MGFPDRRGLICILATAAVLLGNARRDVSGADPTAPSQVPSIVVTDLGHPHQDVGHNSESMTGFALPNVDLLACVLPVVPVTGRGDFCGYLPV